jgi:acetamidase/formamidase
MKVLSRDQRVYVLDSQTTPAINIESGEELMVETWDAFEGERDPDVLNATELKGGATGPIHVSDAQPGDALKIEFLSITPKEGAAHMVMPGRGFLETDFTQGYATAIEFQDGQAVLPTGVKLPLAPT